MKWLGWLIIPAYIIGYIVTAWLIARFELNDAAKDEIEKRRDYPSLYRGKEGPPLVDEADRRDAIGLGGLLALFWPMLAAFAVVVWPVSLILDACAKRLRPPAERAYMAEVERKKLQAEAERLGLKWPGPDDRP